MPRIQILRGFMVFVVAVMVTFIMQYWVGTATIYRPDLAAKRLALHQHIIENRLPLDTTWNNLGANGTNIRIVTVYSAEALHRSLRISVAKAYVLIDTLALFLSLILFYGYLRRWFDGLSALLGILYVSAILPLTYFLYYFHPWDRPSLLTWIVALFLLREGRLLWLAAWLVVGVAVKFDIVVLPGLYWLAHISRRDWLPVTLKAAALFAVAFGTYFALRWALPGGFEPRHVAGLVKSNVSDIVAFNVRFPPLLGFAVPVIAALVGLRFADRFCRASALFGMILFVPFFLATNFVEIRAEMPIVVLLLPAALYGIRSIFTTTPTNEAYAWDRGLAYEVRQERR